MFFHQFLENLIYNKKGILLAEFSKNYAKYMMRSKSQVKHSKSNLVIEKSFDCPIQ